jgi:hypothetical protein
MNNVAYFAIHADDVRRARAFYERVFGWQFRPWGPPDFYLISAGPGGDPGIRGALQQRHEPRAEGGVNAFECTIAVSDVEAIAAAVEQAGGEVVLPPTTIPTVGTMIRFRDTEGNVACAMKYIDKP